MTKIRYRDLTKEQKAYSCNGCGPKGGWIKVPNFLFKASCNHHDFNYLRGYREKDKISADKKFYKAMKEDASEASWWKRPYYYTWAWSYYVAVRYSSRSKKSFRYGDKELTLEMLNEMMRKKK